MSFSHRLGRDSVASACPSEFELDRFLLGELSPSSTEMLRAHVEACAACRSRRSARDVAFSLLEGDEIASMVDRIHRNVIVDSSPRSNDATARPAPWYRRSFLAYPQSIGVLSGLAALALAFVLIGRSVLQDEARAGDAQLVRQDAVRAKGGRQFVVYRERKGSVQVAESGDDFMPGDRLRFAVEVPSPSHVMILGIEASGALFSCFPRPSPDPELPSQEVRAQGLTTLAGAVALDDQAGDERLFLVTCSRPFRRSEVGVLSFAEGLSLPGECAATSFEIHKR